MINMAVIGLIADDNYGWVVMVDKGVAGDSKSAHRTTSGAEDYSTEASHYLVRINK